MKGAEKWRGTGKESKSNALAGAVHVSGFLEGHSCGIVVNAAVQEGGVRGKHRI